MSKKIMQFLVSAVIYALVCISISVLIKPVSIIHFIGPAAGIASGFAIVWGGIAVFSVAIGTLLYAITLMFSTTEPVSLGVFVLAYLAIILQAVWVKQLTDKHIDQQRWLASRDTLLVMLFKIGPLVSVVSGIATIVIAFLHGEDFSASVSYVFFVGWSSSLLTSTFFIPSLLLITGKQKLPITKRFFILTASSLGCIAITFLFKIYQQQSQHQRVGDFRKEQQKITKQLSEEFLFISQQLHALQAFFKASEFISVNEFEKFSSAIISEGETIRALEWIPVVAKANRKDFEIFAKQVLQRDFQIFSQREIEDAETLYPVFYIYPRIGNEAASGLDLNSHAIKRRAILKAVKLKRNIATAPLTLIQDDYTNPGILIFAPIFNATNLNAYGQLPASEGDVVSGFILAVVQFDNFFKKIQSQSIKRNINIFVQDTSDVEPFVIFGETLNKVERLIFSHTLTVFGRQWLVDIGEQKNWVSQAKNKQAWGILIGGTIGGFLFQLLILMMAAYSRELNSQVELKTRVLITAKEMAAADSQAKSQFLQTLSFEIKAQLELLDANVQRLSQGQSLSGNIEQVENISYASARIQNLVENIAELSIIDRGGRFITVGPFNILVFLHELEQHFNEISIEEQTNLVLIVDQKIPQNIISDMTRIKQMLLAFRRCALALFANEMIQLSINIHTIKDQSILFFTISCVNLDLEQQKLLPIYDWLEKDISTFGIDIALAVEISHKMGGGIKLSLSQTGHIVFSCSVQVEINTADEVIHETNISDGAFSKSKKILLIEEKVPVKLEASMLLHQFDYHVELLNNIDELADKLSSNHYSIVVIENINLATDLQAIMDIIVNDKNNNHLPILAIYSTIDFASLPINIREKFTAQLSYPITINKLQPVVENMINQQ